MPAVRTRAALVALLTGVVLLNPAPASADTYPTVTATVWANSPTTAEYRPLAGYTANSTGEDVTVRRTGTGAYTVVLHHSGTTGGVAHVVAYGGGPVFCTVAGAYRAPLGDDDHLILVRCFAATGAAADSRFVATFTNVRQVSQGRLAYFSTDQATPTGVRTLPASLRYDSTGGTISYERLGPGHYRYHRNPDPASEGPVFPMVHVTAQGSTAVHCQGDWPAGGEVYCTNAAGRPVDARFSVTYGSRVDLLGRATGPRFATGTLYRSAVHGDRISGDSYNSTIGGYGGASGTVLATGRYQMIFSGTSTPFGTAFVNAHRGMFDSEPHGYCVLAGWSPVSPDMTVRVNCYTYFGVPANLNAWLSFTTWPAG